MRLVPIIVDKFGNVFEFMDQRMARSMTWQGLPIPELAPRVAIQTGLEGSPQTENGSRYRNGRSRLQNLSSEVASSRANENCEARTLPSAPRLSEPRHHSTHELERDGSLAHEVPSRPAGSWKPTVKFSDPREEASAFASDM